MREVLSRIVGRTLDGVTEARHWADGVRGTGDDALMDFWLHFAGQPPVHCCGDDTGTRLLLSFDEPYASYDLGPHGEFRVEPARPGETLAGYVGATLVAAAPIGARAGVLLQFRAGAGPEVRGLAVLCVDDDLVLRPLDAAPATMGDAEPDSWSGRTEP